MSIDKTKFNKLTALEKDYFEMMQAQYGVLYITSKPGLAKSSIMKSIANKLDINYFDIRLSMIDETDVGLFPHLKELEIVVNGVLEKIPVLGHAVPEWAMVANTKPCIIHFEELNRASLQTRNAALQILLEREIGTKFKFNSQVYMCASGNLGEEDGTDVEEFDAALNNRLIHVKHDLTATQWLEGYAKLNNKLEPIDIHAGERSNVHPIICQFIHNKPEELYKKPTTKDGDNVKAYATPRTWVMLSKYIDVKLQDRPQDYNNLEVIRDIVTNRCNSYIGTSSTTFLRYISDTLQLTIHDILNNFDQVSTKVKKASRDKRSELLDQLKGMATELPNLKDNQIQNLIKFIGVLGEDEVVSYLTDIIDKGQNHNLKSAPYKNILMAYPVYLDKIKKIISSHV